MRKASTATVVTIMAIALYFTLAWGFEGLGALTSPAYGLDDVWRSQMIFSVGRIFGLDPVGLIKLAAFVGAVKLVGAVVCGLHILDRLRSLVGGPADSEVLEGALILVVVLSIVSAGPAVWSNNADLMREQVIHLVLAAIATALCIVERSYRLEDELVPAEAVEAAPHA